MWGTVILDIYSRDEAKDVAEALDGLCDPVNSYGFASGGIYCFWDPATRSVLYIGRAVDLTQRFLQHNGFKGARAKGTKRHEIESHFDSRAKLGFSVLARSPMSQGVIAKHLSGISDELALLNLADGASSVHGEITDAEGIAIRSETLRGGLPPWNKISGSKPRWVSRVTSRDDTGALFTGTLDSLLQARRGLRDLWDDATATRYEEQLHAARIEAAKRTVLDNVQLSDEDILNAIDFVAEQQRAYGNLSYAEDVARIRSDRYLLQKAAAVIAEVHPGRARQRLDWTDGRQIAPGPSAPPLREGPL